MNTNSTKNGAETLQSVSIDLQDRLNWASYLATFITCTINEEHLTPEAHAIWTAAQALYEKHGAREQQYETPVRVAHVLTLNVLIASPEAVMGALRHVRAELVRLDPELAHIAN